MAVLAVHPQRQGFHLPLVPPGRTQRIIYPRVRAKEMTALRKTCQHSAMKHPKQSKRAPPTHPSALAVPSYHRILVKHGLIEKTLSIPDAYKVFLKVGADPEVQKLRRKVEHGDKMKHVPALYLATAMALQGIIYFAVLWSARLRLWPVHAESVPYRPSLPQGYLPIAYLSAATAPMLG